MTERSSAFNELRRTRDAASEREVRANVQVREGHAVTRPYKAQFREHNASDPVVQELLFGEKIRAQPVIIKQSVTMLEQES